MTQTTNKDKIAALEDRTRSIYRNIRACKEHLVEELLRLESGNIPFGFGSEGGGIWESSEILDPDDDTSLISINDYGTWSSDHAGITVSVYYGYKKTTKAELESFIHNNKYYKYSESLSKQYTALRKEITVLEQEDHDIDRLVNKFGTFPKSQAPLHD